MFKWEPLPTHKAIGLVVYKLAHEYSTKFMTNMFCVGVSTIQKYVDIFVDVLLDSAKCLLGIFLYHKEKDYKR